MQAKDLTTFYGLSTKQLNTVSKRLRHRTWSISAICFIATIAGEYLYMSSKDFNVYTAFILILLFAICFDILISLSTTDYEYKVAYVYNKLKDLKVEEVNLDLSSSRLYSLLYLMKGTRYITADTNMNKLSVIFETECGELGIKQLQNISKHLYSFKTEGTNNTTKAYFTEYKNSIIFLGFKED